MADALEPMDKARQVWLRQEKETMYATDEDFRPLLAKRAFAAGWQAGLAHAPPAPDPATVAALSPEILTRLREIATDWGNTLDEVAEGAIIAGIRAWKQEDQEMRASGITVEKVGEQQWKATFATGGGARGEG